MKKVIVYVATTPCGRRYVGQTKHGLKSRSGSHVRAAMRAARFGKSRFQAAILVHGAENILWAEHAAFPFDPADHRSECAAKDAASTLEIQLIDEWNLLNPDHGWNMVRAGSGARSETVSDEERKRRHWEVKKAYRASRPEMKKEAHARWVAKNPDRVKQIYRERYWRCKPQIAVRMRKWQLANKEHLQEYYRRRNQKKKLQKSLSELGVIGLAIGASL